MIYCQHAIYAILKRFGLALYTLYTSPSILYSHNQQIRCNRQRNCSNCVDVGVECQRLRRGRTSRKRSFTRFAASVA
ncbi:hypothetical protein BO86DRAFT_86833 [Aspergillus japonicus CBS 114.51]|uniref:Zn(2)-C6 fungal-type domain-containing protein n=1 Tax=Aspergillus japonicus CBS 114.51 TaxID=1448312 RepID=A0A8T8X3D9_ASPJA|nr:hypothetical protein BO86DRAFT_86833 [Aspergillus japonicus CBS 114.51]RAH82029.1 hypothetical protein BO86DRAFT_86833 [Aspergillus japonicus CBS 114.51]